MFELQFPVKFEYLKKYFLLPEKTEPSLRSRSNTKSRKQEREKKKN